MEQEIVLVEGQDPEKVSIVNRKVNITTQVPTVETLSLADIDQRIASEDNTIKNYNNSIAVSEQRKADLQALRLQVEVVVK